MRVQFSVCYTAGIMYAFGTRSRKHLDILVPELAGLFCRVLEMSPLDFAVIKGRRALKEQLKLYRAGRSHTLRSRHLTGHTCDVAIIKVNEAVWKPDCYYTPCGVCRLRGMGEKIPTGCGGAWHMMGYSSYFEPDSCSALAGRSNLTVLLLHRVRLCPFGIVFFLCLAR